MTHPYDGLEARAFWRSAVAEAGPFGLTGLWTPKFRLERGHGIVTAGSCFAQHIGRALKARGHRWMETEPAPPFFGEAERAAFNYGIFSFRTGNIYTARMLLQWLRLAFDEGAVPDETWEQESRLTDPLRPVIEPGGFDGAAELRAAREATCAAIRRAVREADWFVFTLGLTESWRNTDTGLEYALCPGTVAGRFDPARHAFHNAPMAEILADLSAALELMRRENPALRVLLTVSPVPLTATASGQHVLCASGYSKSVLRAVAGQAASEFDFVDYFPSYEIITSPVFRGIFFAPNMRSVEPQGVETVMGHFFADQERVFGPLDPPEAGAEDPPAAVRRNRDDVTCEEELLGAFAS